MPTSSLLLKMLRGRDRPLKQGTWNGSCGHCAASTACPSSCRLIRRVQAFDYTKLCDNIERVPRMTIDRVDRHARASL